VGVAGTEVSVAVGTGVKVKVGLGVRVGGMGMGVGVGLEQATKISAKNSVSTRIFRSLV
jgi:hypothetical protein